MSPKVRMEICILSVFIVLITFIFTCSLSPQLPTFRYFHEAASSRPNLTETDRDVIELFNKLDQLVPKVMFTHFNQTSSAENSRTTITNPKDTYCIGDHLTVQIDMFDYLGNRKNHGGDFLRARVASPELGAGASGKIQDFNNGTYHVHFSLFWEGAVKVSIMLFHCSEGVSALWKARNKGYEYIRYTGTFRNVTQDVHTECGFHINTTQELCAYLDHRDGEFFYCIKPVRVPCEAFSDLMSNNRQHSHLSDLEKELFRRSGIGAEIKKTFEIIQVSQCNRSRLITEEKCKIGMRSPFPSGYFLHNVWNPVFCTLSSNKITDQMDKCLPGKMIYLMGDSTLRQWIEYFGSVVKRRLLN